jgi:hypothetical protein
MMNMLQGRPIDEDDDELLLRMGTSGLQRTSGESPWVRRSARPDPVCARILYPSRVL